MTAKYGSIKEEAWSHFRDLQVVFLATSEGDQPRVRPVILICFDGKFWVTTGTNNAKVSQIRKNPKVEFCLLFEEEGKRRYIRGAGIAKIVQDKETRTRLAQHCGFFDQYWTSPDDPNYTLLELSIHEVEYLRLHETTARKFTLDSNSA